MKIIKICLILSIILAIIVIWNTLSFSTEEFVLSPLTASSKIHSSAVAERLSQAIQYKTISYSHEVTSAKQEFIKFHQFLSSAFPLLHSATQLTRINQHSLLYHWPGSDPTLRPILLMSHQDVVPVEEKTLDQWHYPPFSGQIENDTVWGRGAVDIKSGLMATMESIESLIASGFAPRRSIYLAFGHDEELGGEHGARNIAKHLKAQNISFEFVLDEGGSIISNGVIPGIDSPVALIGIAEKGYLSLKLTANGDGGHSSMPPEHTALGVISQAIVELESKPFPSNMRYSKQLFKNIGPLMPNIKKTVFANMWLTEPIVEKILSGSPTTNATIRTTTAVTMASGSSKDNVLPTQASAVINFRIMPGETIDSVMEYVKETINNENIVIEQYQGTGFNPSPVSPYNSPGFSLVKRSIYRVLQNEDLVVSPYIVVGGTDAKHYVDLSNNIYRFAFNRFVPETLKQMHGINEQIKISDYVDSIKFYRELILSASNMETL